MKAFQISIITSGFDHLYSSTVPKLPCCKTLKLYKENPLISISTQEQSFLVARVYHALFGRMSFYLFRLRLDAKGVFIMTTKDPSQADSSSSPMPARFLNCDWYPRTWDHLEAPESFKMASASPTEIEDATDRNKKTRLYLRDNRSWRQDVSSLWHEF